MRWPFGPRHTVDSVLETLVEGIEQGTIVLDCAEPPVDRAQQSVRLQELVASSAEQTEREAAISGPVEQFTSQRVDPTRGDQISGAVPPGQPTAG